MRLIRREHEVQWNQIKTLFILCFLALNVYLLYQLYEQQNKQQLFSDPIASTIEEQLEEDNITIPESVLNTGELRESFMTVAQEKFTNNDLIRFDQLKDQRISIIDQTLITSIIEEIVIIPENATEEMITDFLKNLAPFMDEYVFWKWNKHLNIIMFFQQKKDHSIYYNQNALLLFFLDEDNRVVYYSLSKLSEEEDMQESQKLISPIRALETIYNSGQLYYGDTVNKVEVGYHTRIPSSSGVQVFVPTWKIIVNKTRQYFVNAIEGYVFASNDSEFLSEALNEDLKRIQSSLDDQSSDKLRIVTYYKEKLELIH